ncbi:MAG: hypothetical protein P9L97_03230 [Candidatus Tenebribacter davisii]|nr:hypothetical protein [Candidatus Tenebribacter davisii]
MDNIYIKALEIGIENLDNGISYNNMASKMEIENKSTFFQRNFQEWFYTNFYHPDKYIIDADRLKRRNPGYSNSMNDSCSVLTGKAYMDYLDYIELKEARQSSKTAKTIAIISIIITGVIALAQILISICN